MKMTFIGHQGEGMSTGMATCTHKGYLENVEGPCLISASERLYKLTTLLAPGDAAER